MKKLLLLLFLIFITLSSYADIVLYCQDEISGGLIKENNKWKTTQFKEHRYTMKFSDDYTSLDISDGIDSLSYPCRKLFDSGIICTHNDIGYTFRYRTDWQRYMYIKSTHSGYLEDTNNGITESMAAGTCEKF